MVHFIEHRMARMFTLHGKHNQTPLTYLYLFSSVLFRPGNIFCINCMDHMGLMEFQNWKHEIWKHVPYATPY